MHLASQFTLILLLICELAVAAPPIAKPGCQYRCGNISIPFPFGIGAGCYLDEWYEIICNYNVSPPDTLIKSIKMVVTNISINDEYVDNRLLVKSPIIYSNCTGRETIVVLDMIGSPFFYSQGTSFVSVGCNNRALMTQIEPNVVGCESTCDNNKIFEGQNPRCNGTKCCQTTIPTNLRVFNASFEGIHANESGDGCKFAFLADEEWFQVNNPIDPYDVLYMDYPPVALNWIIFEQTPNPFGNNTESTRCHTEPGYSNYTNSIRCYCSGGFEGNPYLPDGCQDIDECKDPKLNNCRKTTCVNLPGSYKCEAQKTWIIILAIGLSFGLLLILIGARWFYRHIKKRKDIKLKKKFFKRLLEQQLTSREGNVENTKLFSLKELGKATDHFNENRILGQGGLGTVYKGMLDDGRIVAVKKSKIVDEGNLEQFINEVIVLSQIIHRNVVKLLGCCLETEVPLLVYEFISNGNLYQYLHDQKEEFPISWAMRLRIATEVAGALSYLHSAAAIPIYHRDVKSTNILLDEKYRAKVADFGTSRSISIDQTHLTTHVQGTFGYLDPEYFQTSQLTDKSDVYSFGVVLVELLTGEKPISFARSQDSRNLATHFILSMKENRIFDILDAQVREHCGNAEIMTVANLAKRCLSFNGKRRPTMKEVTMELERIRLLQKDLTIQNNHEEIEYVNAEISNPWDFNSTSTRSGFDGDSTLSFDIEPMISSESCVL